MSERISLSRILAVNWYGYRQFIDVAGLTLITGANGSGKSALLDLIQFVMLGEAQSKFNKAAAGAGSGRSLRGYCRYDADRVAEVSTGFVRPGAKSLLGQGVFIMTVDQGPDMDRYQGVTAIEGETLALCAEQYFAQSEQTPTRVRLAVGQADVGNGGYPGPEHTVAIKDDEFDAFLVSVKG